MVHNPCLDPNILFLDLLLVLVAFLLQVLLFIIRLLDLLLLSLDLTFVTDIVCYRFLRLFFDIFTCMQTRLTLFKSKTRFIQW